MTSRRDENTDTVINMADDSSQTSMNVPLKDPTSPEDKALPEPKKETPNTGKVGWVGLLSLLLLVIQNTALALTMRASRLPGDKKMYLTTAAVIMAEFFKLICSVVLLGVEKKGVQGAWNAIHSDILSSFQSNALLLIPSGLYFLQNNLQIYAAGHLDPATFQVLYQMKLITTALCSVMMLGRQLSMVQWSSIVILALGIVIVESESFSKQPNKNSAHESQLSGFIAVFVSCCTSAFAGVFLEKLVKQTAPSVWIRNIQLAAIGLFVGVIVCFSKDRETIQEDGFFQGFNSTVWGVVMLQSAGGLLVAVVLKYADNIIKGFATGISILVTYTLSIFIFGVLVSGQYILGAILVVTSVYLYGVNNVPCMDVRKEEPKI